MKRSVPSERTNGKRQKYDESGWQPFFPERGKPVDVERFDAPSVHAPLQWWYGNAQLRVKGESDKRFGFFASFFRQCQDVVPGESSTFHDACTWALIDNREDRYFADSLLDHRAMDEIRRRIDPEFTGRPAEVIESTLLDVMKKGALPRPDRLMKKAAVYTQRPFSVDYDGDSKLTREDADGKHRYRFSHRNPGRNVEVELQLTTARQVPVLHGMDGAVNDMFYYYFPCMTVCGTVRVMGEVFEVDGDGWYDREFGGENSPKGQDALDAWAWLSLRLSNNSQLSVYHVINHTDGETKELIGVLTDADGGRHLCTDVQLSGQDTWTSLVTFLSYPTDFTLSVPSLDLRCEFRPTFPSQEFVTLLVSGYGFFEGCVLGSGVIRGERVGVDGFLEYKNGLTDNSTAGMMKRVTKYVKNTLDRMYPRHASRDWVQNNVLSRHAACGAAQSQKVCDTLFAPVRSLIDRGGKSWRSLILVSCCNALSQDYFDCTKYIAMAELLHVGSLIIDDIQDNSVMRRGGKCVHIEYGLATAINAGTACYFMAPQLAEVHKLPALKANRIYQLYFDVLRAGHAGQGLDIYGLDYLMPEVVATANAEPLFEALNAIHTYKTGGVAGSVCLMAGVLCDANETVCHAMESFGVSIGLAFQIVDDALNLRGFEGKLKEAGEDIREGKITYPIAKALPKLTKDERQLLWNVLRERTDDPNKVRTVVSMIDRTGAITDCLDEARRLVERSWSNLDPLLEESFSKNVMYTFCRYLTERSR